MSGVTVRSSKRFRKFRVGKAGVDLPVEPRDDLGRRAPWDADAREGDRFVSRKRLGERGHVGQRVEALGTEGGERAHSA